MKLNFKLPKLPRLSSLRDIRLPNIPQALRKLEELDREHFRIAAYGIGALLLLMVIAGVTAFSLSLQGDEQTMVPDVRGMELSLALVKMQEKELYPRIALRFTDDPADRGKIVEQSPSPGAIVKAGRRIQLTVSRGVVAPRIENFIGQDINEVKIHLQTLFTSTKAIIQIQEPPVYVFDKSPAGTILEQKPKPDTEVTTMATLEFVVSRGPDRAQVKLPDLTGLGFDDAIAAVEANALNVSFSMRAAARSEKAGTVVAMTPAPGSLVPASAKVQATITMPAAEKGMVAGIYSRDLPDYPYALKVSLEAIKPSGERIPVMAVNHPGGSFTAPYWLPEGSMLVLSVLDREVPPRIEVKAAP